MSTTESSDYADKDMGDEFHGMILDNRYILLHKIGSGGFASVWLSYYMNDPNKQVQNKVYLQYRSPCLPSPDCSLPL